jgi:hypothetical protein
MQEAPRGPLDVDQQKITCHVTQRTHQTLRALASFRGVTKTALANELLVAAIHDAVDALEGRVVLHPAEGTKVGGEPLDKPLTERDYVLRIAGDFCQEYKDQSDYERFGAPGATGVPGEVATL